MWAWAIRRIMTLSRWIDAQFGGFSFHPNCCKRDTQYFPTCEVFSWFFGYVIGSDYWDILPNCIKQMEDRYKIQN